MKGGVAYDPEQRGFTAIIHIWDTVECIGAPEQWSSAKVFRTEEAAMRYYRKAIRPRLKRKMREASKKSDLTFAHQELE